MWVILMGGICGFVGGSDKSLLKSMCNALSHRGSRVDYYVDKDILFAIRALENEASIVRSGDVIIAFEGEIYNSESVKYQLFQETAELNSSSDAELILQLFKQNGTKAFNNLCGSFACAIWNASKQELTLARDHFGQSTLYYSLVDGKIFFASEIKSLLRVEEVPRSMNLEALVNYLLYGYVSSPNTLFSSIIKLPAASTAHFRQETLQGTYPYWSFEFHPEIFNEDEAMSRVYHAIVRTIRLGTSKHKKFAILLSGGFDSSLLAVLARKFVDNPIKAYTFVPSGQKNLSAEFIADQLDLGYHEVTLSTKDAIKAFEVLPKIYDDLIADPFISLPTYALAKAAYHERVIFAADNADVVFWGLPLLYDQYRYVRALQGIPTAVKIFLLNLIRRFKTTYSYQRSLENLLMASVSNAPYAFVGRIFTDREVRKLIRIEHYTISSYDQCSRDTNKAITLTDFYRHHVITASDRPPNISRIRPVCSSFSLKLFEPFFDTQLVELAAKLPPSFKQPSRDADKLILRKMARRYELLPKHFQPRKMGLRCPLDDWYRGELKEWVYQTLSGELPHFIDKHFVISLLKRRSFVDRIYDRSSDHRTSSRDVFTLLMLTLWFKEYAPEAEL